MEQLFGIWREPAVVDVVIVAIVLCGVSLTFRYLSRGEDLGDRGSSDVAERWSVHFECLRLGVELAIIGIVAQFGIVERLFADGRDALGARDFALVRNAVVVQLSLLALATLLSRFYSDPQRSKVKGVLWPNACGFGSVLIAVIVFARLTGGELWP